MLTRDLESYTGSHRHSGPVFFDRGIPDIVGYLRLEGLATPAHIRQAAAIHRYQPQVFLCPPWPAIYSTDSERKQTLETAVRTYDAMVAVYTALGHALIEVPRAPVAERLRFVQGTALARL